MMTAMVAPTMVMMPAVMATPTMVAMPAVMVMTAPVNLRCHGLGCLFRGRIRSRIHQRQRLRAARGYRNREQPGDGCETKNRSDIHLHEHSLLVSLNEFRRVFLSEIRLHHARKSDVNAC